MLGEAHLHKIAHVDDGCKVGYKVEVQPLLSVEIACQLHCALNRGGVDVANSILDANVAKDPTLHIELVVKDRIHEAAEHDLAQPDTSK